MDIFVAVSLKSFWLNSVMASKWESLFVTAQEQQSWQNNDTCEFKRIHTQGFNHIPNNLDFHFDGLTRQALDGNPY